MSISLRRFGADDVRARQDELVELLRDAVDHGASVNFVAPLDTAVAAAFWERVAGEITAHQRAMVAALNGDQIVGCVQLVFAMQPNGLHRAEVQKVLVHTSVRRQGIATQLMCAVEDEARTAKRSLLVLDTERDSNGEKLYERVGYQRAGIIPQFALDSTGSHLIDTVLFYKQLT